MTPRDTARAWLADPLGVVLDFETTGWVGYACEVAVIGMDGETLLHTKINPLVPIEAGAGAVHGITLDAVADAPTWKEIAPSVLAVVEGKTVIAYGAPFDMRLYLREVDRCGPVIGRAGSGAVTRWLCAMQLYRQHAGLAKTVKLETLVPTADHSALGDARACLEVVRRIAA